MLRDRRGAFTYNLMRERVLRLANAIEDASLRKGDIVFTWLPETGEQIEIRLATFETGTPLAMFHAHLDDAQALAMLEVLQPRLCFYDSQRHASIVQEARRIVPQMRMISLGDDYERFLSVGVITQSSTVVGPLDVASLHLTSGTTGQPKIIAVSHQKYMRQLQMMGAGLRSDRAEEGSAIAADVVLIGVPITGPGSGMVLPSLLSGGTLVLPPNYAPETVVQWIQDTCASVAFMSPSGLIDLLDDDAARRRPMLSLRRVLYGSEMMPAAKLAEAIKRYGAIFQQGYGSFEAMPPLAWLGAQDHADALGRPASLTVLSSAGCVAPGVEIRIRSADDEVLLSGEIGQVSVQTPLSFGGYWNQPALNDAALRDGWVYTGDYGYFDDDGRLHLLGRRSDIVRTQGLEIYPRQIEDVAHQHPAVREACLVQVGEHAHLVVTLRAAWRSASSADDAIRSLARFFASALPEVLLRALPSNRLHVFDRMPRSFLNKLLRSQVREALSQRFMDVA